MKFPNMKKMQDALVSQAYNAYCFGFWQGSQTLPNRQKTPEAFSKINQAEYEKEQLSLSEFCKRIKEINIEGKKLWKKHNG